MRNIGFILLVLIMCSSCANDCSFSVINEPNINIDLNGHDAGVDSGDEDSGFDDESC